MVFSSPVFLYFYLPAVLIVYYIAPRRLRNLTLLLFSLLFYGWSEPKWIAIMLFSSVLDYTCSNIIEKHRDSKRIMKSALAVSVVLNLGVLCFFKYTDFLLGSLPFLPRVPRLNIKLPVGISFYTFQTMSCTIDVYRKEAKAQKSLVDFAAYVTLFPQLIAGPIVRYQEIAGQLRGRQETLSGFSEGIGIFCAGLCKKVLLANHFGAVWEQVQNRADISAAGAWLGIFCFAMQIYFDFSGYSDMAIGLGKLFGFTFPVNFNYPYISRSITEFWRRWHITLGAWFREYVYIPLGGNRCGRAKQIRNLCIVWLLTGLWHGASWNFVLWGAFYGLLLIAEKFLFGKKLAKAPRIVQHFYVAAAVLFGWVLFSFTELPALGRFLCAMFGENGGAEAWTAYRVLSSFPLLLTGMLCCTPLPKKLWNRCKARAEWLYPAACCTALLLCTADLVNASYNPFLYFRF